MYVLFRVYLAFKFHNVHKQYFSKLEIVRKELKEREREQRRKENQIIIPAESNINFNVLPSDDEINKKWAKLYEWDNRCKVIGANFLSIFAILVVIINFGDSFKLDVHETGLAAILPSVVSLFNNSFTSFEVKDIPEIYKQIVP